MTPGLEARVDAPSRPSDGPSGKDPGAGGKSPGRRWQRLRADAAGRQFVALLLRKRLYHCPARLPTPARGVSAASGCCFAQTKTRRQSEAELWLGTKRGIDGRPQVPDSPRRAQEPSLPRLDQSARPRAASGGTPGSQRRTLVSIGHGAQTSEAERLLHQPKDPSNSPGEVALGAERRINSLGGWAAHCPGLAFTRR